MKYQLDDVTSENGSVYNFLAVSFVNLKVPTDILEAIEYHKSLIIKEMKNFDKRMSGII